MAISLTDPDNMVVGANIRNMYYSKDGGRSWKKKEMKSTYGVYGDPVIISDLEGNFHFFHLSDPTGENWKSEELLDRIVAQRSTKGGKKWSKGTYMGFHHPKDQDKEWAVLDPANGKIYVTWTQFDKYHSKEEGDESNILFSFSDDGGQTWADAKEINELPGDCMDDDQTTEGAVPAVGPDGTVYVAWAYNEKIWLDHSSDGGATWLEKDIEVANQPGGWNYDVPGISRCNGLPVTVCDLSNGPNRGTVYVLWSDQRNGEEDTDVWITKSSDNGNTWSAPKRVNDDPPGRHQFFGWLDVDPATGHLYVVYYDRRNHGGFSTEVSLAISTDGGETFSNQIISEKPFMPSAKAFFGDYCHVDALNGRIRPVWTRQHANTISIWTALIDLPVPTE